MTARPVRSAQLRIAPALRGAAPACLLLLAALTCNNVNVVTPPEAPGRPILPASAAVDDTCVASVYTGYDSTVCAVRLAWGDGDTTAWLSDSSGDSVTVRHSWYWGAQFLVTAQARNAWGMLSEWSSPCTVVIAGLPPLPDSIVALIPVPEEPIELAASSDGRWLYVGTEMSVSHVVSVDMQSLAVVDTISVDGLGSLTCSADGAFVVASWQLRDSSGVAIIRAPDMVLDTMLRFGEEIGMVALTPDQSRLYAADYATGLVYVIRVADWVIEDTFLVRECVTGIQFSPDGRCAYFSYDAYPLIDVVDVASQLTYAVVDLPGEPCAAYGIALAPTLNRLYVAIEDMMLQGVGIDLAACVVVDTFVCEWLSTWRVAVAPNADWIYYAMDGDGHVAAVRPGETRARAWLAPWPEACRDCCIDLAVLPDGRLCVALESSNCVAILTPTGRGTRASRRPLGRVGVEP